ncbi:late histone H2A.2.2-like [Gavia stellata]|uniref:late histone H2A.2.2-like n=1 Tax=Gavia stellata TaxID=37040 RepID=UPI0028A01982|nr:late histone H2A.2.2-like [Gavia stellata]
METGATSEGQQGWQGQAGEAGRAREDAAWGHLREQAASSMSGEEEVRTVPEQEREPEATRSGGPSEGSEAKAKKSRLSRSSRAGLLFPVSRVDRQLRQGRFAERFGARAPVYLAAVLQWVTHKTMEVAGKISKQSKQQRISPSHLQMAVQKISGLRKLLRGAVPRGRGKAVPQRRRVASPSKKKTTKSKKRCPTQRAAPARATAHNEGTGNHPCHLQKPRQTCYR